MRSRGLLEIEEIRSSLSRRPSRHECWKVPRRGRRIDSERPVSRLLRGVLASPQHLGNSSDLATGSPFVNSSRGARSPSATGRRKHPREARDASSRDSAGPHSSRDGSRHRRCYRHAEKSPSRQKIARARRTSPGVASRVVSRTPADKDRSTSADRASTADCSATRSGP